MAVKKKTIRNKKQKEPNDNYDGSKPLKSLLQEKFVNNIIAGLPQFRAYEQAGYAKNTDNSMMASSSALIRNSKVSKRLEFLRNEIAEKEQITQRETLREAARISFCDIAEVMDDNGNIKDIKSIPLDTRRAIASIEVTEEYQGHGEDREFIGYTKKLRFWDKNKALEKLFKHLGLFAEDNNQRKTVIPVIVTFIEADRQELEQRQIESKTINNDT